MTVRKLKPAPQRIEALVAAGSRFAEDAGEGSVGGSAASGDDRLSWALSLGNATAGRLGYRAGYYDRGLITRVGKIELRVPRDRAGEFSTALFERFQRSEKALVSALAEMYVQGVSTRKVKAITEELCGHSFSASAISAINKGLDESLTKFAQPPAHRALSVPDPGRALREGARGRHHPEPGRAAGHRHQLGRPTSGARRGTRQPGEPLELAGVPGGAQATRPERGRVRGLRRPCGAEARRSPRSCRKRPGNAATCTSCAMPWTTCRARPTTTACRSCAGSTTGATWPRRNAIWRRG